jgi:hypothetical protein
MSKPFSIDLITKVFVVGDQDAVFNVRTANHFVITDATRFIKYRDDVVMLFT